MEEQITYSKQEAQLLRINDVATLTTLSKSCINLWVAEERFPKPITLCATVRVWRLKDIVNWIADQSVKPRNEAVPKKPKAQSLKSIESVTDGFEDGSEKPSLKIVHG
jgi:prophage regulatory protein